MSFLPAVGHHNHEKQFEIQLEQDPLCIYGSGDLAPSTQLKGKVIFYNKAASKVTYIKITLIGKYHLEMKAKDNPNWLGPPVVTEGIVQSDEMVLYDAGAGGSDLPSGYHEWPFSFPINGYHQETLIGMDPNFYSYQLKARAGRESHVKDHKTKRPVRILRTYEPNSHVLYQMNTIDRIWEGKVAYTFTQPCKGVVFGSIAPFKLVLLPLIKGLKLKEVVTRLVEEHIWDFRSEQNPDLPKTSQSIKSVVKRDDFLNLENLETQDIDGAEGYLIQRQIQLPKNLRRCKLTLDPRFPHDDNRSKHPLLHIKHWLDIRVLLINPGDGHVSVLTARLSITVFLRPNQKFDKNLQLLNSGVIPMTNDPDTMTSEFSAPPIYGQHSSDETLDAQDPVNSGLTTPTGLLSSRASTIDMRELHNQSQPSPEAMSGALRDMIDSLNAISDRLGVSSPREPPGRPIPSRASSSIDEVEHFEFSVEALARVPSYNTAARQTEPPLDSRAGLPEYEEATTPTS